jgi:protease PrsW
MTTVRRSRHRRGAWTKIFGWGLLLWVLSAVVTYVTANVLLVPTLVLLGSFLVPVTFVAWAFERGRTDEITTQLLFQMFVVGGVLGVLAASLAESYLLRPSWWMFFGVGFIEEAAKLLALAFCARHLRTSYFAPKKAWDGRAVVTAGMGQARAVLAGGGRCPRPGIIWPRMGCPPWWEAPSGRAGSTGECRSSGVVVKQGIRWGPGRGRVRR